MTTLKITSKGQVTLNKSLLRHLGVGPGQQIEVDELPRERVVVRAARSGGSMTDFIGCLSREGTRSLTVEEMSAIAERGWAGED
ncbi:MAG: AbrB/MazE/SpoVT family DNA-binding domain-containing protein [Gammaproteobacteria bacterium]|nr:AbrB/MazE/SpoVT family DNA-binding domain-containing protein [Gammaproteobacteria bacterium]MYA36752.1 AbrB/MazE/SpoVT family DNA-binding domain-containing protein [Gammaproteobacteria bacterium]